MSSTASIGDGADSHPVGDNNQHSDVVRKKLKWALKKVEAPQAKGKKKRKMDEMDKEEEEDAAVTVSLTEFELVELIRTWAPKRDIICLYVRWGRQLRRNFNLDSIATLLCLSRQCGYKPYDFLRKVKTLTIIRNGHARYGVTFHFMIAKNRKDVDEERLSKEFLGLSVTLSLLQEEVTESPSILGKTGMRHKGPRAAKPMNIPITDTPTTESPHPQHYITAHPNMEFHTEDSLENRMWLSMSHRWAALFLVEHLFSDEDAVTHWSYVDALVYSFQMMAPCGPGRYEFLSPLVGYCLRFPTQESLDAKRKKLDDIHKDPSQFFEYGNRHVLQKSTETQAKIIIDCFTQLQIMPACHKKISYNRKTPWKTQWNMLRAYIFHFWLASTTNAELKNRVSSGLRSPQTCQPNNKNTSGVINEAEVHVVRKVLQTGTPSTHNSKRSAPQRSPPSWLTPQAIVHANIGSPPREDFCCTTRTSASRVNAVAASIAATQRRKVCFEETNWTTMRLITDSELQRYARSYLVIRRPDGSDVVSELSPREVYSANNLHEQVHGRQSGEPPFFPSKKNLSPVTLRIDAEAESYVDVSGKSFYISRKGNENFDEHCQLLPSINRVQDVCRAIVEHGVVDDKQAAGQ